MGKRIKPNTLVQSTWQYGGLAEPLKGRLPDGWDGDGTILVRWLGGRKEWVDRSDFKIVKEDPED